MTQAPHPSAGPSSTPSAAAVAPSGEGELSNLAQLHRMSRTAGLGSSEYTAVNNTAVVAALLGGASSLALFTPIFLFLPIVGVVVSVIAIRQIRSSNGTQTGMALAMVGLIGSLAFAGFTGVQAYQRSQARTADEQEMIQLTANFGQAIAESRYADAYQMTDVRFQEQVKLDAFRQFFEDRLVPVYGAVKAIESNRLFEIQEDPENPGIRLAIGRARVKTEKYGEGFGSEIRYRRTGDRWIIMTLPEWFAPQQQGQGGQPGAMPPGAGGPSGPPAP